MACKPLVVAALAVLLGWGSSHAEAVPAPNTARYWVTLRDKNGVLFNPKQYFSPPARARRARQHLPAYEASDLPVRADYLAQIQSGVDTITLVSRWFNAVACRATPAQAAALRHLPGILAVAAWPQGMVAVTAVASSTASPPFSNLSTSGSPSPVERGPGGEVNRQNEPALISPNDYALARRQTAHLDGPALRRAQLDGRGLRIAIFDVGFAGVREHPAFRQLVAGNHIVATYDFLKNRDDVFQSGSHGTEVLGCLAGHLPAAPGAETGPALGLAPAADYLLARTEQLRRERYAEEEAWLAAAEWADRLGADIINSSLAYTEQRYFPENMTGRYSLVARAANLAARKGMLVVSAAGNDGDNDWVRIGTPADADSVLAVGGLDPETGLHVSFSSVGPTADRRPKPNVAAFGEVLTTLPGGRYERLEGTSFSAPLVAGFAACIWQAHRELTVMQLFRQLEQAAELYPYFDYAHGFGRPRPAHFLNEKGGIKTLETSRVSSEATFDFVVNDTLVAVVLRPAATRRPAHTLPLLADQTEAAAGLAAGGKPPEPAAAPAEKMAPVGQEHPAAEEGTARPLPEPDYPPYLYWHLANRRGVLRRYETRAVTQRLVLQVPRRLLRGGDVLRVHFGGYTGTYSE